MKLTNSKPIIHNSTLLLVLSLFLSLSLVISCDTTDPPSNKKITLEFEDASCTEAWLNLKTENISLPTEINISTNDSTFLSANINSNDTTLFIENLLPSQTYNLHSTIHPYSQSILKSNSVSVTTMDTTSHNFTWETFTFGNRNSIFRDIAIINENNIWAVGEIHTAETDKFDSNGVWVKPYNAVYWDGVKWELKRILVEYMGKPNFAPLHSVFVLPDEKIVFSSGLPYLPDGNDSWKLHHLWDLGVLDKDDASIYSIWGTSLNNLYFAGNKGTIVHFNGNNWRKIESGTEEDLYEIYGDEKSIYVGGGSYMNSTGVLLKGDKTGFDIIKEGTYEYVDTVFEPYFVGSLSTLWLTPKGTLYFGGDALYKNKYNNWDFDRTLEGNCLRCNGGGRYYSSITKIRGNADNDMVLVGLTNTVRHFNGVSWKQLGEEYEPNLSILFWWYSVSMKNNEIIAVGEIGSKAIIRRFKR